MSTTQATPTPERLVEALEFVRERVTDDARRVIRPTSLFETDDGERIWGYAPNTPGDEPCRACLMGWAGVADAAILRIYSADYLTPVEDLIERACADLGIQPDDSDGCEVTRATREGPATLNRVLDTAVQLARSGVEA